MYVGRGLYVMHELRARLLVRERHHLPEGAVDGDENAVPFVEAQAADQRAVGPARDALPDGPDEPVEAVRAEPADLAPDPLLQGGRVEILVVVEREADGP